MSEPLNSNPEILLKKRKDADKLRIQKQELSKKKLERQRLNKLAKKGRFIRAETLVSQSRLNEQVNYRVKRILNNTVNSTGNIANTGTGGASNNTSTVNGTGKLIFILRIPGPSKTITKIPSKITKILNILKLNNNYSGIFLKLTPTIEPLLKICSQFIVIGEPSLFTIRSLLQKRAKIEQDNEIIPLNNSIIEDKLGEFGLICLEDLVMEIYQLGENFKKVINFLGPFKLEAPVHGWGPLNKLKRIELRLETEKVKLSNSGLSGLNEVDIDTFISEQI